MGEDPTILAEKLKREGAKIVNFFKSLDDAEWEKVIYTGDENWDIRNVLAHLVFSEKGFLFLIKGIIAGGEGSALDFNIDEHNSRKQKEYRDIAPNSLINLYVEYRNQMVDFVSSMKPEELDIIGRHPFLGRTTVEEMIKMVYLHNQIHFRDVRRILDESNQ